MMENIEKCLNLKKVRYDIMNKILQRYQQNFPQEEKINIFIDIPSTIKQLYNPENIKGISGTIKKSEKYFIASNLLNMIGHYRHYFASRWKCYTDIFFMYNSKIDKNIQNSFDINYNKSYYEKRIFHDSPVYGDLTSLLQDNYKIMNVIIKCIPHAYFIDTSDIDYRCIFNYILKNITDKEELNIILTTNKDLFQSVLFGNTIILQPKGISSSVVNYRSAIKILAGKSKTIEKHPEYLSLNPENLILIDSLINHKDHDIDGVRNFSYLKALKFLYDKNINADTIIKNKTSIKELFEKYTTNDEIETIIKNFSIFNNQLLMERNEEKLNLLIPSCIVDFNDPEGIRKINEKYFSKFPLQTDFMWEGES